ncbi:LPS assembly protein LptD [Sphingomonas sp. ASV193]|uniref:LPS-assembly protein LptD n=1 Tax=Sphingomonas sp. ASV193 TaxID=3144405 RepID=UPI0032E8729A
MTTSGGTGVGNWGRCWTALPLLLASPAFAQAASDRLPASQSAAPTSPATVADPQRDIDFAADQVAYDDKTEVVTATGQVRMASDGNYLAADKVDWDRRTGLVTADGNVVIVTPEGNKLVSDHVVLTDSLRDGTIDNLLLVLDTGGRIAAREGRRAAGKMTLTDAVYTGCPMVSETGCPRNPSWSITAAKVIRDEATGRLRFEGSRFHIFGLSLPVLPVFAIAGNRDRGVSGLLTPDLRYSHAKGLEIALPYYFRFGPNRDLTLTPRLFTDTYPAIEARYRELNSLGAFQVGGFATYSTISDLDTSGNVISTRKGFRGYGEFNGRYQLDPDWSVTASLRGATDKTLTTLYDLTNDDRLRSTVNLERITPNSYISLAGWYFQGLRVDDVQSQVPIALPMFDARFRLPGPALGGIIQLQANTLAITRTGGQDTQRAFAGFQWDVRRLLPWGQQLTLTAYGRADVYHTDDSAATSVPIYAGTDGWHSRLIGALAADLQWPFIGEALGGIQRITPRIQIVASPPTPNLAIPNEDARAVDLEDSNLFALNRFPGYDRWEDGARVTYGVEWNLDRPNWSADAVIGQSYRLNNAASLFPDGTGLTDRLSDVVGRFRVRYGSLIDITNRFRLDKDNLAIRRSEIDLTVGGSQTYVQAGYLLLNRKIDPSIEDLRDKQELRLAGRLHVARYWSIFGATVIDLTTRAEDPLSLANGFQAVRNRLGIEYEDDCLDIGLSWKQDYETVGALRKGSTFSLRFSLKNFGR